MLSILSFDGTTATPFASGTTSALRAIWGSADSDIWAVGEGGTILRWNGSAWSAHAQSGALGPPGQNNLTGVWGNSASDVWATGDGGLLIHFDGTSWSSVESGNSTLLRTIWTSADQGAITAGQGGAILRYRSP